MDINLYNKILAEAQELMSATDNEDLFLEPTSALKQAASDNGIPYGEEMEEFVEWALDEMDGNHMHENKMGSTLDWNKDIIQKKVSSGGYDDMGAMVKLLNDNGIKVVNTYSSGSDWSNGAIQLKQGDEKYEGIFLTQGDDSEWILIERHEGQDGEGYEDIDLHYYNPMESIEDERSNDNKPLWEGKELNDLIEAITVALKE